MPIFNITKAEMDLDNWIDDSDDEINEGEY